MIKLKLRSRRLKKLDDEQLVKKYQSEEVQKGPFWDEILARYYDVLRGTFYKEFHWYGDSLEDVFNESLATCYADGVFLDWRTGGLSVKNWLFENVLSWKRTKTQAHKDFKEKENRDDFVENIGISEVDEIESRQSLKYGNDKLKEYRKSFEDWEKEIDEKAFEFFDLALNDPDSILTSERKQGRRKVLSALKDNFEQDRNKLDYEKAEEVGMTADSFANRKNRALDDLIEELQDRGYPPEIMAHFPPVLNYNMPPIIKKIEDLLPEMERGETRW